jgi:hypothetical protein
LTLASEVVLISFFKETVPFANVTISRLELRPIDASFTKILSTVTDPEVSLSEISIEENE